MTSRPQHSLESLRVATINVQGGLSDKFFVYLSDQAYQQRLQIIAVQETKVPKHKERHLLPRPQQSDYRGLWNHTTTHYNGKGVGLIISHDWYKFLLTSDTDNNGRGITAVFGFKKGVRLAVINCYIPS